MSSEYDVVDAYTCTIFSVYIVLCYAQNKFCYSGVDAI